MSALEKPAYTVADNVLYGADAHIAEFVRKRLPHASAGFGQCAALGVLKGGVIAGGVVYHNYAGNGRDIHCSAAFDRRDWATRAVLNRLFSFPFEQMGCARITMITPRSNKPARKWIEKAGFVLEGTIRGYFTDRDHAIVYGMLREQCRFLEY